MSKYPARVLAENKIIYHFAGWIIFYYFWYRYFAVDEHRLMANLLAMVTTIFSASTFYFSSYQLIPFLRKKVNLAYFIFLSVLFIAVISFCRALVFLVLNRLLDEEKPIPHFMGLFFSSVFHTSYAFIFSAALTSYIASHRERLKREEEKKESLETELKFLKNQMNPHFLFNIHNSIYFLIQQDPVAAERAVLMLSEIMRYQLYECNTPAVSLEKELQNISNYIELEKIRMGSRIKIAYTMTGTDDEFKIAPFMLLSLVENAFKHVSAFVDKQNFISVDAKLREGYFYLSVINSTEKNNGGTYPDTMGVGIKNLSRRLELIYGKQFELQLTNANDIFSAHIKLPRL